MVHTKAGVLCVTSESWTIAHGNFAWPKLPGILFTKPLWPILVAVGGAAKAHTCDLCLHGQWALNFLFFRSVQADTRKQLTRAVTEAQPPGIKWGRFWGTVDSQEFAEGSGSNFLSFLFKNSKYNVQLQVCYTVIWHLYTLWNDICRKSTNHLSV